MQRVASACLAIWALLAWCASNPMASIAKHPPVDAVELGKKVDAVLDYAESKTASMPLGFSATPPLAETGKDSVGGLLKQAEEMRLNYPEITELKARGALGEDNRGYLALRNDELFANASEKNAVQKTMATENDCRKETYRELARASEEKGLTLTRVERVFAARRLARSQPGALVQLPSNDAEYDSFLKSALAKKLTVPVHPGDWIELP